MTNISSMLLEIQARSHLSPGELARLFGTSLVSVHRWMKGTTQPSPAMLSQIEQQYNAIVINGNRIAFKQVKDFASHGARKSLPLFDVLLPTVELSKETLPPILDRLSNGVFVGSSNDDSLQLLLNKHAYDAETADTPPSNGMSAGKNTYTYDAHTYHTKVPPQGIAELIHHYLPKGGIVLDPFSGSGMTGVAARTLGYDCILNELSPAAAFISNQFNSYIDPDLFDSGVKAILDATHDVRKYLYTTTCRECNSDTELQYVVWSYRVICPHCKKDFQLWDHCRSYGATVKEHKIVKEFDCPFCYSHLKKSTLQRTTAHPVLVGYKCCGSRQQEVTHPPTEEDMHLIQSIEHNPPLAVDFVPQQCLYEGVNLRQPMKHGLDSVAKFYTSRNLSAMTQLWASIHRVEDTNLAAFLAFVFTSLYQRVTRFSEFRFWGGSGNTARFNVPYIFNESNVFMTFARKAKSISDHLRTTAHFYSGQTIVINGSATHLSIIPDNSIDFIFTDPPFGANINYSEMNILWESWLGKFTNARNEAIVNKYQNKNTVMYEALMRQSIEECYRVLRPGHWMLLMFMNTSQEIWEAIRRSIRQTRFSIEKIDMFDKQHGTFKQFVNHNAAGFDLVIHCQKKVTSYNEDSKQQSSKNDSSIIQFLKSRKGMIPLISYVHVHRSDEVDYRQLYSEWLAIAISANNDVVDFSYFRAIAEAFILRGE